MEINVTQTQAWHQEHVNTYHSEALIYENFCRLFQNRFGISHHMLQLSPHKAHANKKKIGTSKLERQGTQLRLSAINSTSICVAKNDILVHTDNNHRKLFTKNPQNYKELMSALQRYKNKIQLIVFHEILKNNWEIHASNIKYIIWKH